MSYRFRDKRRLRSKIAKKCHTPEYLNMQTQYANPVWWGSIHAISSEGVPSDFYNVAGAQKLMSCPLPEIGKSLTICAFIYIQYQSVTDRPTDRFAAAISRSACITCWPATKTSLVVEQEQPECFNICLDGPLTRFSRSRHFWSRISQIPCVLRTVSIEHYRKPHPIYRMVPLSMTLNDLWSGFQGHDIFWSRLSERQSYYCFAQEEKIPNMWNGTMSGDLDWPLNASRGFCQHQLSFLFFTEKVDIIFAWVLQHLNFFSKSVSKFPFFAFTYRRRMMSAAWIFIHIINIKRQLIKIKPTNKNK